ncbi:lytic transglycosylase domain-containing protein [Myroides sp. LJL115]
MNYKGLILSFMSFCSVLVSAQSNDQQGEIQNKITMDSEVYLDSIKQTFVEHIAGAAIERTWLNEILNQDLFLEMEQELSQADFDHSDVVYEELTTEVLKQRLEAMNQKTPFTIEYNPVLEKVIKSFLKNRKRSFERLLGLSEYYFPLFEEKLAQYNVPLEVKYLAIVESALNPEARSRVGATGLWQFMYATGKQYNLEVNSFVDERSDPVKSSIAAAQFLSDLHNMFGDWDLVLASYNAGPGNVAKAIRRSQGQKNYWNIRPNLPRETQNYLPAFYATMYIFEYAKEHGLSASNSTFYSLVQTDTVSLKKVINFEQLSSILDIPQNEIEFLNPTYKLKTIPYIEGQKHFIRLPIDKIGILTSNEDKIYDYLALVESQKEQPNYEMASNMATTSSVNSKYHTIRKGESVGVIAKKYGISVAQLKTMNNLKSNLIYPGKKLVVGKSVIAQPTGNSFYTVKKGDSLYSISKKFSGVTIAKLRSWNNMMDSDALQPGMKLRINAI